MLFFQRDELLNTWGEQILEATWTAFPGLAQNQIAMTWLVYDPLVPVNTGGALTSEEFWRYPIRGFAYRGVELIYPASVVKLFYLVAVYEWLEKGMIRASRTGSGDSRHDCGFQQRCYQSGSGYADRYDQRPRTTAGAV